MKKTIKKILLYFVFAVPVLFLVLFLSFSEKSITIMSAVKNTPKFIKIALMKSDDGTILKGEKEEQINVAIFGIPGDKSLNTAPNLTDTIIIAKLKIKDGTISKISLVSLPRDLYVKIPYSENYTKINALYQVGKKNNNPRPGDLILRKMEEITGLAINYYAIFDLYTVQSIIDRLDGVNVLVEDDIYDPLFPTENFGTEPFEIKKGWQHLDGITAVKYTRTRHTAEGDIGRMKRQQQVIDALRKKIFALNLFWDFEKILGIYEDVKNNVITDLDGSEFERLWLIAKDAPFDSLNSAALGIGQAPPLLLPSHIPLGGVEAFVFVPVEGIEKYGKIREFIEKM